MNDSSYPTTSTEAPSPSADNNAAPSGPPGGPTGGSDTPGDRSDDPRVFWQDLVASLTRERIAAAIHGEATETAAICARRWQAREGGGTARSDERGSLVTAVLADPSGAHIPLIERLRIAHTSSWADWETIGRQAVRLGVATIDELDMALCHLGVPARNRLSACGLSPWRRYRQDNR